MIHFQHSSIIPATPHETFAFHQRLDAIQLLMPPWQRIRIVRQEGGLNVGAVVEFRIGILGIPWMARHVAFQKDRLFTDVQEQGPLRSWRHEHRFLPHAGGTLLEDDIHLSMYGGAIVDFAAAPFAKRALRRMFEYRHHVTRTIVGNGR